MRVAVQIVGTVALFLLAAKAHGRQLRLERQRVLRVDHVVFGGDNPPSVDALWAAERKRFWTLTPLLAAGIGVALWRSDASLRAIALGSLGWAPAMAFVALGGASAVRTGAALREDAAASAGWWAGVVAVAAAVVATGRRGH